MTKIGSLLLLLFSFGNGYGKKDDMYRLFDKTLAHTVLTITVKDKMEIHVSGYNMETKTTIDFKEPLHETSQKNIYLFKIDGFKEAGRNGYTMLEFSNGDSVVGFYIDTVFSQRELAEAFIENRLNLEMAMAFYLIRNMDLKAVQKLPSIMKISEEKLKELRWNVMERNSKVELLKEGVTQVREFGLMMKQGMWRNMQCLLLGHKFPQSKEEEKWLSDALEL